MNQASKKQLPGSSVQSRNRTIRSSQIQIESQRKRPQGWPRQTPVQKNTSGTSTSKNTGKRGNDTAHQQARLVNAWILLNEDADDKGYDDPGSAFQSLINNEVYKCVDILFVCFVTTMQNAHGEWTIGMDEYNHPENGAPSTRVVHPHGLTNSNYLSNIIRDARHVNPAIKIVVTLNWNPANVFSRIFSHDPTQNAARAKAFAKNVASYITHHNLDGLDIDWEKPSCLKINQEQFALMIREIRNAFGELTKKTKKHYYLTLSPADTDNIDSGTVNECVDFVNLQLYSGFTSASDYTSIGIDHSKLACGVKFESRSEHELAPVDSVNGALTKYREGGYKVMTQWRLNSGNFAEEQRMQKELYAKVQELKKAETLAALKAAQKEKIRKSGERTE